LILANSTTAINLFLSHGYNLDNILRLAEVGSTAHGLGTGDDDIDFIAITIESWDELINIAKPKNLFIRTKPKGVRSGPGDVDLQIYTLRSYVNLAMSGNPSVLTAMFSPRVIDYGDGVGILLSTIASCCRSKRAGTAFAGYMTQQRKRWENNAGKKVNRPELVDSHGYDTKYAYHVVRLGYQGAEYLSTGNITMPITGDKLDVLMSIRNGDVDEKGAMELADNANLLLRQAIDSTNLPDLPDYNKVRRSLAEYYWYSFMSPDPIF